MKKVKSLCSAIHISMYLQDSDLFSRDVQGESRKLVLSYKNQSSHDAAM